MTTEPWTITVGAAQSRAGVHQPYIMEISGTQYARMSKRQQDRYDLKRRDEWNASANFKQAWTQSIMDAYDDERFTISEAHPEVQTMIRGELRLRAAAQKQDDFNDRLRQNKISSIDQVNIGDRVFWIMGSKYATIVKKFSKSVRISIDGTTDGFKCDVRTLQWFSYNDVKAAS